MGNEIFKNLGDDAIETITSSDIKAAAKLVKDVENITCGEPDKFLGMSVKDIFDKE